MEGVLIRDSFASADLVAGFQEYPAGVPGAMYAAIPLLMTLGQCFGVT